jgi:parallel beta-helix repeat protein
VLFTNGESREAVLNGFFLTNGSGNRVNIGGRDWYVGGAVFIQYARPTIENCIILDNRTNDAGGGMFMWGSGTTPLIRKCEISGNSSSFGGGLSIRDNCSPTFIETEIIGNESTNSGGGLYLDNNGGPTFERCTFNGNVAAYGGGMSLWDSHPTFLNCTIVENQASWGDGGGICCMDDSDVMLRNTICWDNVPHEINALGDDAGHHLTFEYSDIKGGRDDIQGNDNGEIVWGDGNIDENPEFIEARRNDFNLTEGSPCIDTGDPESNDDPDGTRADMGAFYYHQDNIITETADKIIPVIFGIADIYPNPFNSTVIISYSLQQSRHIRLSVLDISGREVAMLVDDYRASGEHSMVLESFDLSAGLYLIRLQSGSDVAAKKVVLVK